MNKKSVEKEAALIRKTLTFSKVMRIKYHLDETEIPLSKMHKSDQKIVTNLEKRFHTTLVKARIFRYTRIFLFILAYASFVTSFIPFFGLVTNFADRIISVIGITLLLTLISITSAFVNMYTNDANMIATRIIVINDFYRNDRKCKK